MAGTGSDPVTVDLLAATASSTARAPAPHPGGGAGGLQLRVGERTSTRSRWPASSRLTCSGWSAPRPRCTDLSGHCVTLRQIRSRSDWSPHTCIRFGSGSRSHGLLVCAARRSSSLIAKPPLSQIAKPENKCFPRSTSSTMGCKQVDVRAGALGQQLLPGRGRGAARARQHGVKPSKRAAPPA